MNIHYASAEDAEDAFYEAIGRGDIDALMQLYMPDAVVALHDQPKLKGLDAIRAYFAPRIGKGKVAGRRVTWYRQDPGDSDSAFSRQTLLTLKRKWGYVAHIWVVADTEQQLLDRLSVLERIVFKAP